MPEDNSRGGHNRWRLIEGIIGLSESGTWDEAKQEWELVEMFRAVNELGTCLCGKKGIVEQCVLLNTLNGNMATVGNVCVKKFVGLPSDKIFNCLKRVGEDPSKGLNPETVVFAHARGWINDWEKGFCGSTWQKPRLSPNQRSTREEINRKVLARFHGAR